MRYWYRNENCAGAGAVVTCGDRPAWLPKDEVSSMTLARAARILERRKDDPIRPEFIWLTARRVVRYAALQRSETGLRLSAKYLMGFERG